MAGERGSDETVGGGPDHRRLVGRLEIAALAVAAVLPFLLSSPGAVSADTKAYLHLDPGRLLGRAGWLWDTHVAGGTVTHQNIGYLFPLGPYFWLMDTLGVPTWVAQRLWFGAVFLAAGLGARWMLRRLGLRGVGPIVAAFAYMLSPYVLAYTGRTSVILLPWAALPWLVGLLHLAIHEQETRRRWRAPLLLGIVVTLMAGTNASSVVFVLVGPALLVPFMVLVTHESSWRVSGRAILRTALVTAPAQLWWMAGLWAQGRYGLPILQLTETVETVAQTSTGPEILRGLGYWYFYGRDGLSQWTDAGTLFTQNPGLLAIGWLLPALALLAGLLTRWRYRAYFIVLVLVGLVLGIGTHPYDAPSPIGWLLKTSTEMEAGFALRNSPRAVPLLVLGLAGLLACGVEATVGRLARRATPARRRTAIAVPIATIAVILVAIPPVWSAQLVQPDLQYPDPLPSYWRDAIDAVESIAGDGRVLELPGSDFYAYRWGATQDPITPGLTDTPWVGRELTAYGSPASVDLLRALDRRLQEGVSDASGVADVARLFSARALLLRLDTQYERYRAPRPADLWRIFSDRSTTGLRLVETFGEPYVPTADSRQPTIDELELARRGDRSVAPLALFEVDDVPPLLRAVPTAAPTVVWGDGDGIVDAAESGLLPGNGHALLYAATVTGREGLLASTRDAGPSLIVTDTNRRRSQRWGTLRENNGATETAGSVALVDDPKDARLDLFPGSTDDSRTTAWFGEDVADVRASSYGNIVAHSAEARPANAVDGDPTTAWSTGGYSDVIGDRLQVDYTRPVTADHIDVRQLQGNRWITRLTVLLDGRAVATVRMDDSSFVGPGQRIGLGGPRTFRSLTLRIDDANVHGLQSYVGVSNVGLAEVTVPGVTATEWIRVPTAGLRELATAGPTTPLSWVLTRWRADALEGFRQDPETRLLRIIDVPVDGVDRLTGSARLSAAVDGARVDELLGRPGLEQGWPIVTGSVWLDGDLRSRPSSADDGDLSTAWTTPFGRQVGAEITVRAPSPMAIDQLRLSVVADGRHSVPTALEVVGDDGTARVVAVPAITDSADLDHVETVVVPLPPMRTRTLTVRIADEREVTTKEYFGGGQHAFPIAIAELGLPEVVAPLPAEVPATCHSDVLTIDGRDLPVRLVGSTATALSRGALDLLPCDPLRLEIGERRIASTSGSTTGIDVDRLVLGRSVAVPPPTGPAPTITDERTSELSWSARADGATSPYWVVLGQSWSDGWKATANGRDLGAPVLIDGMANGWLVDPAVIGPDAVISITWPPQRVVWTATIFSAIWFGGILLTLAAGSVLAARRRRAGVANAVALVDAPVARAVPSPQVVAPPVRTVPSPRRWLALLVAVVLGASIGGPTVALLLGAVTLVAILVPHGRWTLVAALVGSLGLVTAITVVWQWHSRYRPGVEWPTAFPLTHVLTIVAVLTVAVDATLRWSQGSSGSDAPDATGRGDQPAGGV